MNATTRPRPAAATKLSTAAAPRAPRKPVMTMDPAKFPDLRKAIDGIRAAIYLAQNGLELIDDDEPKGLPFIVQGLKRHLADAEREMEAADRAASAIAPRMNAADAVDLLVRHLVRDSRSEIAEADMLGLVQAYKAESEAAPDATCAVVLDRARQRLKAETSAA